MESNSVDELSKSSRDNSIKDLGTSQTSLKSTKSLDKSSTGGSFKQEKNSIHFKTELNQEFDNQRVHPDASLKVPHKIIANWRSACDRTKDKTKDLLKRWRTLPEIEAESIVKQVDSLDKSESQHDSSGWSVHIWTTWVDRFSVDSGEDTDGKCAYQLTPIQSSKFSHFFTTLLDHDQDNLISEQDFETLIEGVLHGVVRMIQDYIMNKSHSKVVLYFKDMVGYFKSRSRNISACNLSCIIFAILLKTVNYLLTSKKFHACYSDKKRLRHFADWSVNSPEFNILREIERGFIQTFLTGISNEKFGFSVNDVSYLTKEGWLHKWSELMNGSKNLGDFPVWLQFFVKVLFQVINRSGTGIVTRDELSAFYSSVLGLDAVKVGEILDHAYQAMTSNGDHLLHFRSYRLCFSNYLLGRYPNGPGQYILGAPPNSMSSIMFPVDYSALNAEPEDLEQYMPDQKSNRRSVIV